MIIKKYVVDTMNEALNLIKLELGPNAIIVSKRDVKQKGIFGIFLPKKLEVTAAIDGGIDKSLKEDAYAKGEGRYLNNKEIENEINEVKEILQKIAGEKKAKNDRRKVGMKKLLLERDVHEDVVNSLIASIKSGDKYKNVSRIPDSALKEEIYNLIRVSRIKGRIQAFIGPTGVGKTTTVAKLAALDSINSGKKVGLITIDTYRIGAVEQLKIYADILGIPLQVVNSINDIERALENLKECDTILVDTTGRSTKNVMHLSELKLYLNRMKPDVIHLCMSVTTKYSDMVNIITGFEAMNYSSIILTKFDETSTYGSIVNAAYNAKVPISYISVGQNVPDDLEEATKDKLLDLVIGGGTI